jgi:hypothetical protein
MKLAFSLLLGLPFLAPLLGGGHALTGSQLEQRVKTQMNGSAAGQITKRVDCAPAARVEHDGSLRYGCSLVGTNGSAQRIVVHVSGQSWRADWAPLKG